MEHPFVLSICAFLMLMVLLTWVGYRVFYKPGKFLKQLGTPVITDEKAQLKDSSEPEASTLVTLLHQIGSRIPSSETESATLRTDLIRAGFRSENAAPVFYGIRIVSTFGMLIVCLMMDSHMPPNPMMKVALLGFGCCARLDSAQIRPGKEGQGAHGSAPPFAPRCAGSSGGLGGSRAGPGPGHSARGPRASRQPSRNSARKCRW